MFGRNKTGKEVATNKDGEVGLSVVPDTGRDVIEGTCTDITKNHRYNVGDQIKVEQFFWIPDFLGYDSNAYHAHGLRDEDGGGGGSCDTDCTLEVRGIEDEHYIVSLIKRDRTPAGALAATGSVFRISREYIDGTEERHRALIKARAERARVLSKYKK